MNRKLVPGLVILVPVAYLGLGWGSGRMAHAQLDAWRERTATQLPILKVFDVKVTHGLFSSSEEVTYELDFTGLPGWMDKDDPGLHPASATGTPQSLRFTLRNRIQHGPLPGFSGFGMARIDTTLVLDENIRQTLMANIGTDRPLEMITRIGFTGGGTSELNGPAFQYLHEASNLTFDWQGMRSRFDFGRNMDSLAGSMTLPGLRVSGAEKDTGMARSFDLGEVRLDADLERAIGELFTGKMSFVMTGFTLSEGNKSPVTGKDARYDLDMTMTDDYLDMAIRMGLAQLSIRDTQVSDMHYDLSLRHLHAPTYAQLQARMQALQWKSLNGDPTASMELIGLIGEYAPRLLEHKPELAVDHLGFTLPEGTLRISGKVGLPDFAKDDLQAGMPALMAKVDAAFDITMSEGLLAKDWSGAAGPGANAFAGKAVVDPETGEPPHAPNPGMARLQALKAQARTLEEQGFIKRSGDSLESRIEFRKGALTVNGKPMGPPATN